MILQEEFKKNGYKDILVKDNASKYDIGRSGKKLKYSRKMFYGN